MTEPQRQFLIPAQQHIDDVKEQLLRAFPFREDHVGPRERIFFDTFDWRLHLAGYTLEQERIGAASRLIWRDAESGDVLRWLEGASMPAFPSELEPGPFAERLATLTDIRALVPLVEIHSSTRRLALHNDEGKTVLTVEMCVDEVREPGASRIRRLPKRLTLIPVRGYARPLERVSRFVARGVGLPVAPRPLLHEAAAARAPVPRDYTGKLELQLDPNIASAVALRTVMLHLLDTIEINVDGTRSHTDTEFLHDLRVAVRRTRTLLSRVRGVFPPPVVEYFKTEFRWMGSITSPCRDLDVYMMRMDDYKSSLSAEGAEALAPFADFLESEHRREQARLTAALESERFGRLLRDWRAFLIASPQRDPDAPEAFRAIRAVASERIRKTYRHVVRDGRAIGPEAPPEAFHELRITCKKLRYLMECFRSIYPRRRIARFISALKKLQENLGDYQDCSVQAEALDQFAERMREKGLAGADTLDALHQLAAGVLEHREEAHDAFWATFRQFDTPANRQIARELFREREKRAA